MDDWIMDEKSLIKWQELKHCKSFILVFFKKGWKNKKLGSHLMLVTLQNVFTISTEQDN